MRFDRGWLNNWKNLSGGSYGPTVWNISTIAHKEDMLLNRANNALERYNKELNHPLLGYQEGKGRFKVCVLV